MSDDSWSEVTALCRRVASDLDELARASTLGIRKDLTTYAAVPFDEHLVTVGEQQRRRLDALAEGRLLAAEDLGRATELARRRARQGITVDVLIGAYHVGDRELWRALCAEAGNATPKLPKVASLMFDSLHAISTVLAAAHGEVTRELQSHRVTLSQRFIELLTGTEAIDGETARIADALGFDPAAGFVALTWRRPGSQVVLPSELQRELDRLPGVVVDSFHDGDILLIAQGVTSADLTDLAVRHFRDGRAGVGLVRDGLAGAADSITDAQLALAAASPAHPVVVWADGWHLALLLSRADQIGPLVSAVVALARQHTHLAEAVMAFADADMSLVEAAKAVHLHANTISYRLERWAHLTGWDPRTFDGLIRSVTACRLAEC